MDQKDLEILIKEGEGLTVEFKERYSPRIAEDIVGFSNSKGGYLLLGVNDRGEIVGNRISNAVKAEIVNLTRNCNPSIEIKTEQIGNVMVIIVAEGEEKPYSCSGGYFKRLDAATHKMTQKETAGMFRSGANAMFERLTNNDATLADISIQKVNSFLATAGINLVANKNNIPDILTNLKLMEKGKYCNAALLMFAKDVGKFFLQSQIALALYKNHNKVEFLDRKQIRDDIQTQFSEAMVFLEKHLNRRGKIVGTERIDTYEVPIEAVREAVANAIIHRDYSIQGTDVFVELYPDTLEISNPGGLMAGLSVKELGKKSLRRNEIICDLFHRMHKIEKMGTGIKRIKDSVKAAGLKGPKFESNYFFTTIFYLPQGPEVTGKGPEKVPEKVLEKVLEGVLEKVTENQKRILRELINNAYSTNAKLSVSVGISERKIRENLKKLKTIGVVKRIGPDRGGHWEVVRK